MLLSLAEVATMWIKSSFLKASLLGSATLTFLLISDPQGLSTAKRFL